MKKHLFSLLILLSFVFTVSAQNEARKIDEFGYIQCGEFSARMDALLSELLKTQNSTVYVIYYEGKSRIVSKRTKNGFKEILEYPKRGSALNRAKEVVLYAEERKKEHLENLKNDQDYHSPLKDLDLSRIILSDGGYRFDFTLEIWLLPSGAKPPTATPTVDKKDVKFTSKGKPRGIRNCARAYDIYLCRTFAF